MLHRTIRWRIIKKTNGLLELFYHLNKTILEPLGHTLTKEPVFGYIRLIPVAGIYAVADNGQTAIMMRRSKIKNYPALVRVMLHEMCHACQHEAGMEVGPHDTFFELLAHKIKKQYNIDIMCENI